jgi:hypothetical protein
MCHHATYGLHANEAQGEGRRHKEDTIGQDTIGYDKTKKASKKQQHTSSESDIRAGVASAHQPYRIDRYRQPQPQAGHPSIIRTETCDIMPLTVCTQVRRRGKGGVTRSTR